MMSLATSCPDLALKRVIAARGAPRGCMRPPLTPKAASSAVWSRAESCVSPFATAPFCPRVTTPAAAGKNPQAKMRLRYPVLYDLHGLGDNEQSLMNTGAWSLIQDLREQHKIGEFLIVTPDGGRSFYINSRDGRERYSDFFLQEFMPTIEHRYRVRAGRNSRGITGMSMGGYGALRFAFAYPQLFSSVSAHSAALVAEPPRPSNHGRRRGISARGDGGRAIW